MKCLFIYNPYSSRSKEIVERLDYIVNRLQSKYDVVHVYETKKDKDAMYQASHACGIYDIVVVAGGDGTFNEVIRGIAKEENRPKIGYIPCGTVCDNAKNFGIKRNIKKALNTILEGKEMSIDIGKINDDYFSYAAAVGIFSDVSYNTNIKAKKVFGRLSYFFSALKEVNKIENLDIKIINNGKVYSDKCLLILVSQAKSVGGFNINNGNSFGDGKVEVIVVKKDMFGGFLKVLKLFFLGIKASKNDKKIRCFSGNEFSIILDEKYYWNIDGEKGCGGSVNIKILPKHISLIVSEKTYNKSMEKLQEIK